MKKHTNNQGFTLVELAISLIIISMIIGGVLVGQDLIDQARLGTVASEIQKVQAAYNQYKQKYNQVPGDDSNAFSYFGTDCAADAGSCNGNGDDDLRDDGDETYQESYMFWRHLYAEKLYNQNLSGTFAPSLAIGTNLPKLPIDGITFVANTWRKKWYYVSDGLDIEGDSSYGVRANILSIQRLCSSTDDPMPNCFAFYPTDAKIIDQKIDDGIPNSGNIIEGGGMPSDCVTGYSTGELTEPGVSYHVGYDDTYGDPTNCQLGAILQEPL